MNILLQAAPQGGNNFLLLILMFVAMFAFMIFAKLLNSKFSVLFYEKNSRTSSDFDCENALRFFFLSLPSHRRKNHKGKHSNKHKDQ